MCIKDKGDMIISIEVSGGSGYDAEYAVDGRGGAKYGVNKGVDAGHHVGAIDGDLGWLCNRICMEYKQ